MARKNNAPSTRERYQRWTEQADELLAELSKAQAHNASRREGRA